ncbi:MAG: spsK1 [Firmicutes bacterium]|nr:spsK1 [Bacillota bacterium]
MKGKVNIKALVTGATGQVGYDVVKELKVRNIDVIRIGSKDCAITSFKDIKKFRAN